MQIVSYGLTDVGRVRKHNEDCFLIDRDLALYLVCDGMGGHAAGDLASETTANTVRDYVGHRREVLEAVARGERPLTDLETMLSHAIQAASARIHQFGLADPKKRGMGTTCVAVLFVAGKAVMAHVGDSRLYLARSGQVYQLSEDHTFLNEAIKRGMLTPEQAKNNPHSNIVTRAVGPTPTVVVDTLVFDVLAGDTLLLCSDGLHGYVERADELSDALRAAVLPEIAAGLVERANAAGGSDNITTVLMRAVADRLDSVEQITRAERVNAELQALKHVVLFSELDMKELVKVANTFRPRRFEADEVVVHEGDVAETLFVIITGQAVVTRGGQEIAGLRAGDHFGEMALLSRRPRSATVRTLESSELLALERDRFYELMSTDAVISAKFLWRLAQTLSLRLDDIYLLREQQMTGDRPSQTPPTTTMNLGLFPSPFDRR